MQIKHIICLTLKYCWWKKSGKPVDRLFVLLFTGFYTSQVVQDFFHQQYEASSQATLWLLAFWDKLLFLVLFESKE